METENETEESECGEPCAPSSPCDKCSDYWHSMREQGLWDNKKGWSQSAINSMCLH